MKITSYQITPIATIDPPLRAASGLHAPYALRVALEPACEDGLSGITEIPCTDGDVDSLTHICEGFLGSDPLQLPRLLDTANKCLTIQDEARGDSPCNQGVWVHPRSGIAKNRTRLGISSVALVIPYHV